MDWLEMDVTKMTFEENLFDCVKDKGTLDAIMCGNDPRWLYDFLFHHSMIFFSSSQNK